MVWKETECDAKDHINFNYHWINDFVAMSVWKKSRESAVVHIQYSLLSLII